MLLFFVVIPALGALLQFLASILLGLLGIAITIAVIVGVILLCIAFPPLIIIVVIVLIYAGIHNKSSKPGPE